MAAVITDERGLVSAALALGAEQLGPLTPAERELARTAGRLSNALASDLSAQIAAGEDPLGDAFALLRSPEQRRPLGATYTPAPIVESMVAWAADRGRPDRVVDPGAGSARFAVAAGRRFAGAHLVAVEIDPLAALCARAHLAAAGLAKRSTVIVGDFRALSLDHRGRTLWLGNPPYVRHHQIAPDWKDWLAREARRRGHKASKLAGLHVHFFLATVLQGAPGDYGAFITAAEWMDVNYGSLVRQLLLDGLGGISVHVLDPKAGPFADAATTGAITCFELGSNPRTMRLRSVEKVADLQKLEGGRVVRRERLLEAPRWTVLMRKSRPVPEGHIELGELCRVHRGAVTGANCVWVTSPEDGRLPAEVLTPSVTRARELFAAGDAIESADQLRRVVDLPEDLDEIDTAHRPAVEQFLEWAKSQGAHQGYIARHRRAWWSVGLREPAPILATYMARRPPTFVRNLADARHINIAHGLYPRETMSDAALDALAASLRSAVTQAQGRTYAGGLTKFEPREMERIPIPVPNSW